MTHNIELLTYVCGGFHGAGPNNWIEMFLPASSGALALIILFKTALDDFYPSRILMIVKKWARIIEPKYFMEGLSVLPFINKTIILLQFLGILLIPVGKE